MSKLWIGKKLHSVENEVRDYVEQLEKENKRLLTIIKNALTTLAIISMPTMDNDVATDEELLKTMGDSFREALKGGD